MRLLHRLTGAPRARRHQLARGRSQSVGSAMGSSRRLRSGRTLTTFRRHRAALAFGAFFIFLGAVNLYVLYLRRDTSVPALLNLASAGRRAGLNLGAHTRLLGPPGTPPVPVSAVRRSRAVQVLPDYPRVVEVALKVGDTLQAVLRSHIANVPVSDQLEGSLRGLLDPGGLGNGQSLTFYYDSDDRLAAVDYRLTDSSAFHLERVATGSAERFVSSRQEQLFSRQTAAVAITIERDGDFATAVTRSGEQPALGFRIGEIFACELSAFTDLRAGDRVRVVVEKLLLGGNLYRYGRLLAAEYLPAARPAAPNGAPVRPLRAFLSPSGRGLLSAGAASGSSTQYYTDSGDSLTRALCRTPLLYGKAPGGLLATTGAAASRSVVRAERGRAAVDYLAPSGTPVVAAGPGKVIFHGKRAGLGNVVIISHPGGIETSYQQLGRFARGLVDGQPVRLRQVIGYVEKPASATAPAPFVHYVLRVNGKQIDSTKYKSPREPGLAAAQRPAFFEQVGDLLERLGQAQPGAGSPPLLAAGRSAPATSP